jgi:hypothetical protein
MSVSTTPTVKRVIVRIPASRFVTFKLKDTDKTMRQINPFHIQKALDAITGKVESVKNVMNEKRHATDRNVK